jgi:hypothetical protein
VTIRLYLDEDSSDTDLITALRMRSVDILSVSDCAMRGHTDEQQLHWATEHQRVLYSLNRGDFYRIHTDSLRNGQNHSGIILGVQQRYSVGEQMHRLVRIIHRLTAEDMINRIEFLSSWT